MHICSLLFLFADKEAVEKRLFVLQKQGHNIYTKTNDFFIWNTPLGKKERKKDSIGIIQSPA